MHQPDPSALTALPATVVLHDQTLAMLTVVLLYMTLFSALSVVLVRRWL